MAKIVLNLASSLDGFIAEPDGGVKFLDRFTPTKDDDYGMTAFMSEVDASIMGGKTYEDSLKLGPMPRGNYVVVTRRTDLPKKPGVEFYNGPLSDLASRMRKTHKRTIWHMGGGKLASAFLDEGLLDEMIITYVPVLLGRGIPLYVAGTKEPRLTLISERHWKDGAVQLHFRVEKGPRKP